MPSGAHPILGSTNRVVAANDGQGSRRSKRCNEFGLGLSQRLESTSIDVVHVARAAAENGLSACGCSSAPSSTTAPTQGSYNRPRLACTECAKDTTDRKIKFSHHISGAWSQTRLTSVSFPAVGSDSDVSLGTERAQRDEPEHVGVRQLGVAGFAQSVGDHGGSQYKDRDQRECRIHPAALGCSRLPSLHAQPRRPPRPGRARRRSPECQDVQYGILGVHKIGKLHRMAFESSGRAGHDLGYRCHVHHRELHRTSYSRRVRAEDMVEPLALGAQVTPSRRGSGVPSGCGGPGWFRPRRGASKVRLGVPRVPVTGELLAVVLHHRLEHFRVCRMRTAASFPGSGALWLIRARTRRRALGEPGSTEFCSPLTLV
jgi:hypothetical protein